ncbi:transmembrane protein, putative (macronuclear) [Tetrahymena thermophila SB210]|uniref:Transmembrane protein, putative n=1 Tax=Tetrahymena thermophila (strain SB210) TaxID=312017 RepID=Q22MH3_TETTS|nr:transmembrane protein, putative [Tetrahymena thermophila SB210]EAR86582.2 transmembrane protein, putative [Tetrahymena thermophila SB210]|eukprot:XP_977047.2 transmembrane protein, putative [Tetrahymena thermophila SB210]
MNTDFTLPTEYQQLTTEGPFISQKKDLNEVNFSNAKQNSPSNDISHLFNSSGFDQNHLIRNCISENKILDELDKADSANIQKQNDQQEIQMNLEHDYLNRSDIFTQKNNQMNEEILQIRIDHSEDVFEYFEKEPSYQAIEIIDYERFLSLVEFAQIDLKLRKLSKKFKALRITNVDLTTHHLKILQYGILQNRRDLEIQLNNNNIDDQSFFQFLLESRCFKLIQFINNIGILKFIDYIYEKYSGKTIKRRNMLRLTEYNIVLEKSDNDLIITLHTGSNQFRYLKDWSDQYKKYQVVNYDIKQCSKEVVKKILHCEFTNNHLPVILSLSLKVESWNVEQISDILQKLNTVNTLDLGGSIDLAEYDVAKIFFHEKQFKIKDLIIRDIPFKNPAFKLFVQHFLYSDFTITKSIDISNCEINDDKVFLLCENLRVRKERIPLQQIYLQKNPYIGTEGWRRLFSMMIFGRCTAITDLDLRGCLITKSHLQDGIIAGYKSSQRISKKFCIRMPLRTLFVSSSEMTPECWKIFTKEFLFHPKINLENYNFFFTGYFMSNKILTNKCMNDNIIEIRHNESKDTHTLQSSLKQSQKAYQDNELTAYSKTQLNQSGHSTPKSLKVYNLNQLHLEIKKNEQICKSYEDQIFNYPKSSISKDQNSYKINKNTHDDKQIIYQVNDQTFNNKSQFDDITEESEINLNNSHLNLKQDNSQNQQQTKSHFQLNQIHPNSRTQSQTSLNQTKSIFSKETTQKLQIHKINQQDDQNALNILNQSNIDNSFTSIPFQQDQLHLQVCQKNYFCKSQKSKSLNELHSPQQQDQPSKEKQQINEENKIEQNESGIYLNQQNKLKHIENFDNNSNYSNHNNHHNEKFKNQLHSQKIDNYIKEKSRDSDKHNEKENDSQKTKSKSNKEQTLNLIYNSDLDNLKIEQIPGVGSTFSQSVQISYLELLQVKQQQHTQNFQSSQTQPLNMKNESSQQKHLQNNGKLVRLHSYSHQKKNILDKNNFSQQGKNKKIFRSISFNSQNHAQIRFDEYYKQNILNKQVQDKNNSNVVPYYKKSSFGHKHVKSAQEIVENINQVVSQNTFTDIMQNIEEHNNSKTSYNDILNGKNEKTNTPKVFQDDNSQSFQLQAKNSQSDQEQILKNSVSDNENSKNSKNVSQSFLDTNNLQKSLKEQQQIYNGLLSPPKQLSNSKLQDPSLNIPMQFIKTETFDAKNQAKTQNTNDSPNKQKKFIQRQSANIMDNSVNLNKRKASNLQQSYQTDQERAESEKLNFKQMKVVDKYRKNNIFYKKFRAKNEAGVINKQEILGSVENAIYNLLECYTLQKKPHLKQIILHTTDQFPYLSTHIQQQNTTEFQGNISPAGWSRLFFLMQKCQIFVVPLSNNNPQLPITPLFNEKYEYMHPIPEEIIKESSTTELYQNLIFFYINADRLYHKIYKGKLTPIQWLYFNPNSKIKIIKSNCYSTFINLERNIKLDKKENNYTFKTEIIDFNWEGEEKGWKIFALNVMLCKRFQLKQLYLKNVNIDKIIQVLEEYKLKYNKTEIPSQLWNLSILCFSFSSCTSSQQLAKFLFYFFNSDQLKVIYNGKEDSFYIFGQDYQHELLTFNTSDISSRMIDDPYCLNRHIKYPYSLQAPYISQFYVNKKGYFSPHFFTGSICVQLITKFQCNKIIQAFDRQISVYLSNMNKKIQNYLQSRSPSIPAVKLKQFICESNEQKYRTQYSKLIEPCLILHQSREDFTDQIVQFNCSLFEGGSLIIEPQKLKRIVTAVNLINLYQFYFINQQNLQQKQDQQNDFRTYSIQKKINQEIHIYLSLEDKLRMYGEISSLKNSSEQIKLYANYIQYLQHKQYLEKMNQIGMNPTYHHPYNYYNCLYVNNKSVVLMFETTCSNSCGQRCGKTADIIYYYKETYAESQKIPDYLTYIKLNKKVSPYFFSTFLFNKIVDLYSEEHILSLLFCTVYTEDYNYRFFDYVKLLHVYFLIIFQFLVCILVISFSQDMHKYEYLDSSFAYLPLCLSVLLFLWQFQKVVILISKSKQVFAIQSIISRKRTFEKKQTIRNRQQVRQLKNKNTIEDQKCQSQKNLEEIDCSPQSHWLLYKTPLDVYKSNKLIIFFASFKSFVANIAFYSQIFFFSDCVNIFFIYHK